MRILHHKVGAILTAVLVLFTGTARGENAMKKNLKLARPDVPQVHTTRSGSRFVRAIDVIRSQAGRKELSLQLKSAKRSLKSDAGSLKTKS